MKTSSAWSWWVGIAGSACTGTSTSTCIVDLGTAPPAGEHVVSLIATDAKEHTALLEVTYSVPPPGSAPVIDTQTASHSGSTFKVTGTAHDVDNDLNKVELAVVGIAGATACTGTASYSCSLSTTGWAAGSYTATVIAFDVDGHAASADVGFTIAAKATCVTAKNSAHHWGPGALRRVLYDQRVRQRHQPVPGLRHRVV